MDQRRRRREDVIARENVLRKSGSKFVHKFRSRVETDPHAIRAVVIFRGQMRVFSELARARLPASFSQQSLCLLRSVVRV